MEVQQHFFSLTCTVGLFSYGWTCVKKTLKAVGVVSVGFIEATVQQPNREEKCVYHEHSFQLGRGSIMIRRVHQLSACLN